MDSGLWVRVFGCGVQSGWRKNEAPVWFRGSITRRRGGVWEVNKKG